MGVNPSQVASGVGLFWNLSTPASLARRFTKLGKKGRRSRVELFVLTQDAHLHLKMAAKKTLVRRNVYAVKKG